jgi:aryl-alcohol dehydrogenase-like predicted oxidoreductase
MDYRNLGRSGLKVSTLTLGTMGFGGAGQFEPIGQLGVEDAKRQLDLCIEAGVNLIDTANMYSGGRSEEVLGEALEGRREQLMVATKVRFPVGDGPNDSGLSRHHIIASVEESLGRLRAEHIDLLQLHEWDGSTPVEEFMEALDTLVRSGKVRYIGASNFTAWQLMKALGAADAHNWQRFVGHQIHYTPQARESEFELIPAGLDQGLGTIVWSPLAGGLLSGKYRRDADDPEGTRRAQGWTEPPVYDEDKLYDIIDALVEVGEAHDVSAAQATLAWLLTRPSVTTLVIAARTEEQLRDNLAAADLELTDDEVAKIEQASRPDLPYPLWHQVAGASDRFSDADRTVLAPWL